MPVDHHHQSQIDVLKSEQNRIRNEVEHLKSQVGDIKTDVALLKSKFQDLENMIRSIERSMTNSFNSIEKKIDEFREDILKRYVTNEKFEPVKMIVYGLATGVFTTVLGAGLGKILL